MQFVSLCEKEVNEAVEPVPQLGHRITSEQIQGL